MSWLTCVRSPDIHILLLFLWWACVCVVCFFFGYSSVGSRLVLGWSSVGVSHSLDRKWEPFRRRRTHTRWHLELCWGLAGGAPGDNSKLFKGTFIFNGAALKCVTAECELYLFNNNIYCVRRATIRGESPNGHRSFGDVERVSACVFFGRLWGGETFQSFLFRLNVLPRRTSNTRKLQFEEKKNIEYRLSFSMFPLGSPRAHFAWANSEKYLKDFN